MEGRERDDMDRECSMIYSVYHDCDAMRISVEARESLRLEP